MKVGIFDLKDTSEETKSKIADSIADFMLADRACSICRKGFERGDNATVSGVHPLALAHNHCWKSRPIPES